MSVALALAPGKEAKRHANPECSQPSDVSALGSLRIEGPACPQAETCEDSWTRRCVHRGRQGEIELALTRLLRLTGQRWSHLTLPAPPFYVSPETYTSRTGKERLEGKMSAGQSASGRFDRAGSLAEEVEGAGPWTTALKRLRSSVRRGDLPPHLFSKNTYFPVSVTAVRSYWGPMLLIWPNPCPTICPRWLPSIRFGKKGDSPRSGTRRELDHSCSVIRVF